MKNRIVTFFSCSLLVSTMFSQTGWTWTELSPMPEKVSNNAVVEGFDGNDAYVFSFSGIDTTKTHSGINLGAYRYDVTNDTWSTLPDLPDTLGKIAAGVSRVGDKLYIIGGYHVLPGGSEISSDKVHVFNVLTNSYETDGASIPVPIDDQVQCVYKDSLIYVITGWSNTNNVPDVQIYDPALDQWSVGTPTPNDNYYKAFGASGTIVGDTIFYNGGVRSGFNFAAVRFTRKGIIDPNDPTQITWTQIADNPGATGYRMACSNYEEKVFWLGGGGVAYNFNGIAYTGGAGVPPLDRILQFNSATYGWDEGLGTPFQVMDLRGIGKISDTEWIICGGMEAGQQVSNKTYLITYDPVIGAVQESDWKALKVSPNPVKGVLNLDLSRVASFQIIDLSGKLILKGNTSGSLDVSSLPSGLYLLLVEEDGAFYRTKFEKE
jgi:N-acetylneuraminic acid mutarotase